MSNLLTDKSFGKRRSRNNGNPTGILLFLVAAVLLVLAISPASGQQATQTQDFRNYETAFDLGEDREATDYGVTVLDSGAPGHIFHEGEQPEFEFQVENLTGEPLEADGRIEVIRYGTFYDPDHDRAQWRPTIEKYEDVAEIPLSLDLEPEGWTNVTIQPPTPETKGGYALIVDLGDHGRRYLASYIRTLARELERIQFPVHSLESKDPEILARLGVQAIRYGVSFEPLDTDRTREGKPYFDWLDEQFQELHENKVTVMAEIGSGNTYEQPLGRTRPHLDEDGVMQQTKSDHVWLPKHDDEFEEYVYHLVSNYGWPNGPITAITIWNEPWEGSSISGWQADMLRYRELHRRMGDAVFRAREEHGVEVLVGGADSSSNTWDKFFPEGIENSPFWPEYLDFCSIHYQGMSSPAKYKAWNEREHYMGRVKIWDTESWVANSEDRFLSVFAANRAAGYDRTMGSLSRYAVSNLSHGRVAHDTIRTEEGEETIERLLETRPLGAAYGAVQHFFGEREFDQVLFETGLPWVFVFHGLDDNPEDGSVAVAGDITTVFGDQPQLFEGVRTLAEVEAKRPLRDELDALEPDEHGRRAELYEQLAERHPFRDATMRIANPEGLFSAYDHYGNLAQQGETLELALDSKSHILRADPEEEGSFDQLLEALKEAEIQGLQPLEIVAYDMTNEVANRPSVELRLTNQLNQPVEGALNVALGELEIAYPERLSFAPRERKTVEIEVTGGEARTDNTYPLAVDFDAGEHGLAPLREDMHVNLISRRTITLDGDLSDWEGALPQTINAVGDLGPTMTEAAWLPFEEFEEGIATGFATAYVAYDDDHFYFAARVADDEAVPAPVRFGERDDDFYFYPEVSYEETDDGERIEHHWPEGVRHFSYRRNPDLPSSGGSGRNFDNILIGFNVLEPGEDKHTIRNLPGRPPRFGHYKTTDYQLGLHQIAEEAGGGTEVYMLETPDMPRKHHYPRQPEHPDEGPVDGAELEVGYNDDTRIVEAAIPWSAIPTVHERMEAGEPIRFSYRVNHGEQSPTMELSQGRSAAEGNSRSFNPDWQRSYPNVLVFSWE